MNGMNIKGIAWDYQGDGYPLLLIRQELKKYDGCLLVFDLTEKTSFDILQRYLDEIKEQTQETFVCLLVGNKKDQKSKKEVTQKDVEEFMNRERKIIGYLEVSAKTGENVHTAFVTLLSAMTLHIIEGEPIRLTRPTLTDEENRERRRRCRDRC